MIRTKKYFALMSHDPFQASISDPTNSSPMPSARESSNCVINHDFLRRSRRSSLAIRPFASSFAAAHSNLLSQPCNHSPPVLHPCHLTVLSNSAQPFTEDCIQRPPGRLSCRHKRMRQTGTLALPSTYLSHSRYQPIGVTRHPAALLHPPSRMTGL